MGLEAEGSRLCEWKLSPAPSWGSPGVSGLRGKSGWFPHALAHELLPGAGPPEAVQSPLLPRFLDTNSDPMWGLSFAFRCTEAPRGCRWAGQRRDGHEATPTPSLSFLSAHDAC